MEKINRLNNSWTGIYKVYGTAGHRQKESFCTSYEWEDSSVEFAVRKITVYNSDLTGTNDYTIIRIERATPDEVKEELFGQLSDGVFENCHTGKIEEITYQDLHTELRYAIEKLSMKDEELLGEFWFDDVFEEKYGVDEEKKAQKEEENFQLWLQTQVRNFKNLF